MSTDTLDTTAELLEDVTNKVDDPEALYELRSARQLLVLAKQRQKD